MHRDDDRGFDLADYFGSLIRINRIDAPHRNKQNIHPIQTIDLSGGQLMTKISQVDNRKSVDLYTEYRTLSTFFSLLVIVINP